MSLVKTINDITVSLGGTASKSNTLTGALDALIDTLAGEDVDVPKNFEGAFKLLGEHIGTGGEGGSNMFKLHVIDANYVSGETDTPSYPVIMVDDTPLELTDETVSIEEYSIESKCCMVPEGSIFSTETDPAYSELTAIVYADTGVVINLPTFTADLELSSYYVMPNMDALFVVAMPIEGGTGYSE